MKCVCGYIYEDHEVETDDKPFIALRTFARNHPAQFNTPCNNKQEKQNRKTYQLHMCPKCGTIRGELI